MIRGLALYFCLILLSYAQEYGQADRSQPGDAMIQAFLAKDAESLEAQFTDDLETWHSKRAQWKKEYLYMLGLSPMPERTPLEATVTGQVTGDGFRIENLHYQSSPRLYVTANVYRPARITEGQRLPAILYVCGHAPGGRDGNKTRYQANGIWFARHGYVCMIVDTVQIGEIAGTHHGTYRENRWWWHSRGYTPAGVECWNGMRGLDYLVSRSDVDADRLGVTGISGGGAVTFWVAAADERVKVAVPISGMADLPSYVSNQVINGHCDCVFFNNAYCWPWSRAAALIAPRPMLFTNSHLDPIFPMDANDRITNRLERIYSLYGKGDLVDCLISRGGHAYRKDIRQGTFRFFNTHLKGDSRAISDSEVDLSVRKGTHFEGAIDPMTLRVFPTDADIPNNHINSNIDHHFVPIAQPPLPTTKTHTYWKDELIQGLRRGGFQWMPEQVSAARVVSVNHNRTLIETEPGIQLAMPSTLQPKKPKRIIVIVRSEHSEEPWWTNFTQPDDAVYHCFPRGVSDSAWTQNNPPNYVERSMVLLGRTADACRVYDVMATCQWLQSQEIPLVLAGKGRAAVIAAYAALFEPKIAEIVLHAPAVSHMESKAPQILNALRTCDIPDVLGMLAPRKLTLLQCDPTAFERVDKIYSVLGSIDEFIIH